MIEVCFYDKIDDSLLKFAVIAAKTEKGFVYCKHKDRGTYEIPGGHREAGEDILATAKRELYEETGAIDFDIMPVCVYSVKGTDNTITQQEETFGMLYYAEVRDFVILPDYEMEEIVFLHQNPDQWTYPQIQPILNDKIREFIENLS